MNQCHATQSPESLKALISESLEQQKILSTWREWFLTVSRASLMIPDRRHSDWELPAAFGIPIAVSPNKSPALQERAAK